MTTTSNADRWSRGCGLGIGLSHHKNEYRLGVNIGNWTEDVPSVATQQATPLYPGAGFDGTTTQRASYGADGKYGPEAAEAGERRDLELKFSGDRSAKILIAHGPSDEPPTSCYATLNQLTLKEKTLDDPRVQTYLWNGNKLNDRNVPRDVTASNLTTTRKMQEWNDEDNYNMYATTSKLAQETVVGQYSKRETMRPAADGGQIAQVGRKAKGEMAASFKNPANKVGYRTAL
uniref:Flagellar associated protein n=1 Tax=Tetraselmis chuii TaxID=63592 RepID=A0A7S1T3A1_9CHLO|mmetsp:Transcript_41543/g.74676  ORF Transcript_41543/g.74676 Transcript_41543/m.74676 type:complete len:232 (+) Transcript_41543:252-947(+)|eukprot:CAMPEP_0177753498 /NCGR_PEP_ID=MMETSP0491_2-20121128/1493_1 /TAXON_ID=63592 /ORGANISM="Tetraselmis chuii, Strain PLY429" /LENGTH=231 /DNA_ID=CAMNT_0019268789 /DNA_START=241 /DNA_END=936 /DNA_ORIENTATION=+